MRKELASDTLCISISKHHVNVRMQQRSFSPKCHGVQQQQQEEEEEEEEQKNALHSSSSSSRAQEEQQK